MYHINENGLLIRRDRVKLAVNERKRPELKSRFVFLEKLNELEIIIAIIHLTQTYIFSDIFVGVAVIVAKGL